MLGSDTFSQKIDSNTGPMAVLHVSPVAPLITLWLPSRARCQFSTLYSRKPSCSSTENSGCVFHSGLDRPIRTNSWQKCQDSDDRLEGRSPPTAFALDYAVCAVDETVSGGLKGLGTSSSRVTGRDLCRSCNFQSIFPPLPTYQTLIIWYSHLTPSRQLNWTRESS